MRKGSQKPGGQNVQNGSSVNSRIALLTAPGFWLPTPISNRFFRYNVRRFMNKAAFYDLDGTLLSCNLVSMHAYYARNDRSPVKSVYQFLKVLLSVPSAFRTRSLFAVAVQHCFLPGVPGNASRSADRAGG